MFAQCYNFFIKIVDKVVQKLLAAGSKERKRELGAKFASNSQ